MYLKAASADGDHVTLMNNVVILVLFHHSCNVLCYACLLVVFCGCHQCVFTLVCIYAHLALLPGSHVVRALHVIGT